jgi:hypothetical protein
MDTSTFVEERDGWFENLPPESGDPLSQFYHKAKCVRGDYKGREMTAFDFGGANLYRRYGAEWEKHSVDLAHRRLQSWGMNTLGCWSADEVIKCSRTPFVHWVYNAPRNIRAWGITVKPFPDFFDPGFEKTFERRAQNMAGRYKDDPLCIGFFSDNELCWGTVTTAGRLALKAPADQPAKVRMIAMLREKYGDVSKLNQVWKTQFADWEAFDQPVIPPDAARRDMEEYCRLTAEHYFSVCSRVLHRVAPKKLYLGCRFAEYNAIVVEAANRYCDVVSFNLYSTTVKAWAPPAALTRPVLIGEFHFGAPDRGPFGSGLVGVENQRERAAALTQYVEGALQNPLIIGAHWFQYRDEPASGRTLEGENHQIGLVDICDTPCPETIEAVRNVTRRMYSLRADVR